MIYSRKQSEEQCSFPLFSVLPLLPLGTVIQHCVALHISSISGKVDSQSLSSLFSYLTMLLTLRFTKTTDAPANMLMERTWRLKVNLRNVQQIKDVSFCHHLFWEIYNHLNGFHLMSLSLLTFKIFKYFPWISVLKDAFGYLFDIYLEFTKIACVCVLVVIYCLWTYTILFSRDPWVLGRGGVINIYSWAFHNLFLVIL